VQVVVPEAPLGVPAWARVQASPAEPVAAAPAWVRVLVRRGSVLVRRGSVLARRGSVLARRVAGVLVVLAAAVRLGRAVAAVPDSAAVPVAAARPGLAAALPAVVVLVVAAAPSAGSAARGRSAAGAAGAVRNSSRWARPSWSSVLRSRSRASFGSRAASPCRTWPTAWAGPPAT
ncbi:MAG TPA: hypothetical protein VF995_10295, partial [Actinomycetota bacterium]